MKMARNAHHIVWTSIITLIGPSCSACINRLLCCHENFWRAIKAKTKWYPSKKELPPWVTVLWQHRRVVYWHCASAALCSRQQRLKSQMYPSFPSCLYNSFYTVRPNAAHGEFLWQWDMMPYNVVYIYQRCGGTFCLRLIPPHDHMILCPRQPFHSC